jgi:hypothetical protein
LRAIFVQAIDNAVDEELEQMDRIQKENSKFDSYIQEALDRIRDEISHIGMWEWKAVDGVKKSIALTSCSFFSFFFRNPKPNGSWPSSHPALRKRTARGWMVAKTRSTSASSWTSLERGQSQSEYRTNWKVSPFSF